MPLKPCNDSDRNENEHPGDQTGPMRVRLKRSRLEKAVFESQLSQNHLAMRMGLSSGHLADLVNGKTSYPSPMTREKILKELDISFEDLFEIEGANSDSESKHLRARFQSGISERYAIDSVIGQGGMGTVYLARDVKHGRQVAIKVVLPDVVEELGTQQFLKEIRQTAGLQHPNILPVYDSGVGAECPYFVMPYVREGSLHSLLEERGPLGLKEALGFLKGVCDALTEAHGRRLVHCDIKPENILVSGGQAVVVDFGISRAIHIEGATRRAGIDASSGTPAYVSPEQASGETAIDPRSDQYSVACVLYEMLSGQPPFRGLNDMAVISQRFLGQPPDLKEAVPDLPFAVAAVVRRAMSVDPRRRFSSIAEFFEAVEFAIESGKVSVLDRVDGLIHKASDMVGRLLRFGKKSKSNPKKSLRPMRHLIPDLKFAIRSLIRKPLVPIAAVLSLGLGIAANTVIFSFVNAYLLRPLPFELPEQLVHLEAADRFGPSRVSIPDYLDWRDGNQTFQDLAAYNYTEENLTEGDTPQRIAAARVSANLFDVLQARALIGRSFLEGEDLPGAEKVAVIHEKFWDDHFGRDASILEKSLSIDGVEYAIVGVMARDVVFPLPSTSFWITRTLNPSSSRGSPILEIVGRMKPGVTMEAAQADMDRVSVNIASGNAEVDPDLRAVVGDLWEAVSFISSIVRPISAIVMVAVILVLLLACANVANLLLSQGKVREREMSLRMAVGAGRRRVIGQLLTESTLLALMSGLFGVGLALLATKALEGAMPGDLYRVGEISIDSTVLAFSVFVTLATAIIFGLAPALQASRVSVVDGLKEGSGGSGSGRKAKFFQSLLVSGQIGGAIVLLVTTGLLVRSLNNLKTVDPGFDTESVMTMKAILPSTRYPTAAATRQYHRSVVDRLGALPGVEAVATVNYLPLNNETAGISFRLQSAAEEGGEQSAIKLVVSGDFFEVMDIPVSRGRVFSFDGTATGGDEVVIDESLAEKHFPEVDPVGRLLWLDDDQDPVTIIGVAAPVILHDFAIGPEPVIYLPSSRSAWRYHRVLVRTAGDPNLMAARLRQEMAALDPLLPISELRSTGKVIDDYLLPQRGLAQVLVVLGFSAAVLALLGVYALTTFSVSQRVKEIAVRRSLGATVGKVKEMIVRQTLVLATWGVLGGVVGGFALAQVLGTFLFGVRSFDFLSYGVPVLGLVAAAGVFGYLAARRVSKIQPIEVLRS